MTFVFPAPKVRRLANGATALTVGATGRRRAVLTAYFPTGSRFETLETNGTSHFLEHMLFRGCPSYPATTRPDRWFCSEDDAQAAGFRKAYNCRRPK